MKHRKLFSAPTWEQVCAQLFRNKEDNLTAEELRELLSYDPETGEFVWLVDRISGSGRGRVNVHAGDRAGSEAWDGYVHIEVNNILYKAHRLAFLLMTGRWPSEQIDRKNRIRDDNRWCNLREATQSQNNANQLGHTKSSGLPRGVVKATGCVRFVAKVQEVYLGIYKTPEEASAAYEEAAREIFGEFYCPPNPMDEGCHD